MFQFRWLGRFINVVSRLIANDVALGSVESYQMGPKFQFGVAKSIIVWKTQALSFMWR